MKRCEIRMSDELHAAIVRIIAQISIKTGETAPSIHSIFIKAIEEYVEKKSKESEKNN